MIRRTSLCPGQILASLKQREKTAFIPTITEKLQQKNDANKHKKGIEDLQVWV